MTFNNQTALDDIMVYELAHGEAWPLTVVSAYMTVGNRLVVNVDMRGETKP